MSEPLCFRELMTIKAKEYLHILFEQLEFDNITLGITTYAEYIDLLEGDVEFEEIFKFIEECEEAIRKLIDGDNK